MVTELFLAVGQTTVTKPDFFTTLVGAGPFGILAALFIWGLVIPKKPYDDVAADRDYWREAYRTESTNHEKTREALVAQERRSDAAIEAASTATRILDSLQHAASKTDRA